MALFLWSFLITSWKANYTTFLLTHKHTVNQLFWWNMSKWRFYEKNFKPLERYLYPMQTGCVACRNVPCYLVSCRRKQMEEWCVKIPGITSTNCSSCSGFLNRNTPISAELLFRHNIKKIKIIYIFLIVLHCHNDLMTLTCHYRQVLKVSPQSKVLKEQSLKYEVGVYKWICLPQEWRLTDNLNFQRTLNIIKIQLPPLFFF